MERTAVRRVARRLWRVVEIDGGLVRSWLPGLEEDDRHGPLDRGGFDQYSDAWSFSLGLDYERAFHGRLTGINARDIDREREALDYPNEEPLVVLPELVATEVLPVLPEVISAAEQERWNLELKRRLQLHRVA